MADASLGTAVLRTQLDTTGLSRGLTNAGREVESFARTADDRLNRIGVGLTNVGRNLTVGLTLPITAAGAAIIKAASDAEETASKFATVYRVLGQGAEVAADQLATSFGLSSTNARRLLGDTGDLLTGFGFTADAALDLSVQVNELAVDLASFTNFSGGAAGASAALTKALLGERESVKSLGISILETDVQARVLLNTQQGLTFESERQAKAFATLQIAQEQSKNAIGDFARTSDSFANQQRVLAGEVNNLAVSLGTILLPAATSAVTSAKNLVTAFNSLEPAAQRNVLVFAGVAAAVGPVTLAVGGLVRAYGALVVIIPRVVAGYATIRAATTALVASNTTLQGALVATRAVMATLWGPAGIIVAGVTALAALSRQLLVTTDALNRFANQSIAVDGLSEEARNLSRTILELDDARQGFVLGLAEQSERGELDLEGARAAVQRYDANVQGLRDRFGEVVREAAALRDGVTAVPDLDIALNVAGLDDFQAILADLSGGGAVPVLDLALPDPTREARNWTGRLLDEVRLGLQDERGAFDILSPRFQELQQEARDALSGFGFDSVEYQDTLAKLDVVQAAVDQLSASLGVPLVIEPTVSANRVPVPGVSVAVAPARDVTPLTGGQLAAREADIASRLASVTRGIEAITPAFTASVAGAINVIPLTAGQIAAQSADIATRLEGVTRSLDDITPAFRVSVAEALNVIPLTAGQLAAQMLDVGERLRSVTRTLEQITPNVGVTVASAVNVVPLSAGQLSGFGVDAGTRLAERRAGEAAAAQAVADAGRQFNQQVIVAGAQFAAGLVESIRSGDVRGALTNAFSTAGAVLSAGSNFLGAGGSFLGLGASAIPGLGLVAALLPIFGSLLGGLFQPGQSQREQDAVRAAGVGPRGAPAIEFNVNVQQSLNVQSLTDPAGRAAVDGLLNDTVNRILRVVEANIIPRVQRLEAMA